MNSFELFEMTMEKINNYQVEKIKEELRNNGLPGACKMLHEFISNLDDKCFEDTFPITYGFDKERKEKKGKREGYFACYTVKDYKEASPKGKKELEKAGCSECNSKGYVYGNNIREKAELDHFLTRLLYEAALDKETTLKQVSEPGLFTLAAEVMGKEELAKELKAKVEEGNKDKEERIKDNIRKIIEETNYTRDNE